MRKTIRINEDIKQIKIEAEEGSSNELSRQKSMAQKDKSRYYRLGWNDRRKLKKNLEEAYLIHMLFGNGTSKTFVLTTTKKTFKMKGKTYFLYFEETWFNISMNMYELFYNEKFSVPINREIIQQGNEAYFNVTPENLKQIIDFEYVKVLAGAHSFSKILKTLLVIGFVNIAIAIISIFLKYNGK
jgi:hypothetical protein